MKKILFVLLIALLVVGLIACANAREKAVENIIEGMIEKESGEKIDIDIDESGDSITMESDEGEVTVQSDESGLPWPGDKLPAGFPMLNGATFTTVIDVGEGIVIGFAGCTQNDVDAFTANFTTGGWETSTMESAGLKIFTAFNDDETMQVHWRPDDGEGNITYSEKN